jgi:hypothetical protein
LDGACQVVKGGSLEEDEGPWVEPKVVWEYRRQRSKGGKSGGGGGGVGKQNESWFGERVLVGSRASRGATVRAVGATRLLHIDRSVWNSIYSNAMREVVARCTLEQHVREPAVLIDELAASTGNIPRLCPSTPLGCGDPGGGGARRWVGWWQVAEHGLLTQAGHLDDAEAMARRIAELCRESRLPQPVLEAPTPGTRRRGAPGSVSIYDTVPSWLGFTYVAPVLIKKY